jgi:brefeldin A-inhibited guanine nucleotide-exchange protein
VCSSDLSSLARLINLAGGGREDSSYFEGSEKRQGHDAAANAHKASLDAIDRYNASLLAAVVTESDITRIYTKSTSLTPEAAGDFVIQLAAVSLAELRSVVPPLPDFPTIGSDKPAPSNRATVNYGISGSAAAPRIFSLQKVVEVADYNMNTRSRMVWAKIWTILSQYFTAVCCSPNASIAMYAIDSLKQLSAKFLEKPELRSFHFQTKFLQPFLTLMGSAAVARSREGLPTSGNHGPKLRLTGPASAYMYAPSQEIRELILHICANLIRQRHANIRSGWRTFMGVYAAAASDNDELLVSLAFSTVHEVITTHIEAVASSGAFTDAFKCMVAFGSNSHPLFSLRAIDHCATLGVQLARGRVPLTEDAVDEYDLSDRKSVV